MLRIEVRAAIFRARQTQTPVKAGSIAAELQGERYSVDLHVRSAKELAPDFLLVVFEEHGIESIERIVEAQPAEPLIRQLETELDHVKTNQRATVEEYESSLEELKASNEELQSINEELRSATEEVETSREEPEIRRAWTWISDFAQSCPNARGPDYGNKRRTRPRCYLYGRASDRIRIRLSGQR
jgi:two-component system, chemotaxis family, CheB/CheR fusion protein